MDITIQGRKSEAILSDGRYYKSFTPQSADETIKIHALAGCMGDTKLTNIQLEKGNLATDFVVPRSDRTRLSGILKDLRSLNLQLTDSKSDLWGKIRANNKGMLTEFFDKEVSTSISQLANAIDQRVTRADVESRISQLADTIDQRVTGADFASIFKQNSDSIVLAIKDKMPKMTGSEIKTAINLSEDGIRLKGESIYLDGHALIDNAVIKSAMIDKITAANLTAEMIESEHIKAEAIEAKHVNVTDALIEKLVANEALIDNLFAKEAMINKLQTISLDASQITTGILSGDFIKGGEITGTTVKASTITGSTVESGVLTGNTKIQIGQYGSLDTVNGGLQINVPEEIDSKKGLGVQFIGSAGRHSDLGKEAPYGLFIYKDDDITKSGEALKTDEFLLTVQGYIKAEGVGWLRFGQSSVNGSTTGTISFWASQNVALDFGGANDIYYTYNGTAYSLWALVDKHFSDRRLKENIVDSAHNALDYVKQFNFKSYDWKEQEGRERKAHTKIGLIAQEVQEIDETLVYENGGTLNLDNLRLTNIALKAIQELNTRLEKLENGQRTA